MKHNNTYLIILVSIQFLIFLFPIIKPINSPLDVVMHQPDLIMDIFSHAHQTVPLIDLPLYKTSSKLFTFEHSVTMNKLELLS